MQEIVHGLKRAKKTSEALPQMRRRLSRREKIAMAKEIR
jgi:hypothetical protein